MSSALCLSFRLPANICGTALAVLQNGMVIERAFALWKRRQYEYYGCSIGVTITAFCVLFSAAFTYWALSLMDLSSPVAYCSDSTDETEESLTMLFFFLCAVDVISLIGVALLHTFNASAIRRKVFDLRSSYQLQENAAVIRLLLPLSVFDTICHLVFSTSNGIIQLFRASFSYVTYRTIFASTYILPYYGVVSPILLWLIIRKSKQLRVAKLRVIGLRYTNEREVYFQGYNQMWETVEAK
ncbi:Integral membrane protein [Trichostrongylus colubriformis]|uniref:Integral membrane protein n=1 Tax=Trichostrongylus colubriformis TaxID=6319 RepID=A0AAN8FQR9_TRICO